MTWYYAIVVVLVLGGVAVLAAGRGGAMGEVERRTPHRLPEGDLGADDVRSVRFTSAARGYRMDEVDALLDRLATQLDAADPARGWIGDEGAPDEERGAGA